MKKNLVSDGKLQMYFTELRKLIFKHLTFLLWSLIFIKKVRTKKCIMFHYDTINNSKDGHILSSGKNYPVSGRIQVNIVGVSPH